MDISDRSENSFTMFSDPQNTENLLHSVIFNIDWAISKNKLFVKSGNILRNNIY